MQDMSERRYAAHAGLSRGAIQKAKAAGRLALHADGSIDAAASDRRRAESTDPTLTVSQWADAHRNLSPRASAEPGRYRTARTPYMRAIMDALSPGDPVQRVVFQKAAQTGATEAGNNWLGFIMHHAPGPVLAVQPTVELAKRNSRQRIDPLIEDSPALRDRVRPARARDAGNTMLSKEFAGGILILTGANSAVGLRSAPAVPPQPGPATAAHRAQWSECPALPASASCCAHGRLRAGRDAPLFLHSINSESRPRMPVSPTHRCRTAGRPPTG